MKSNIVKEKSLQLAILVIEFAEELRLNDKHALCDQLIRCGTSVGANISEAQHSESRADFIHKMKIAAKELEETKYWLELCRLSKGYPYNNEIKTTAEDVGLILYKIISTSKANFKNQEI